MSYLKEQKVLKHDKARDENGELVTGKPFLKTQVKAERFRPVSGKAPAKGAPVVEVVDETDTAEDAPVE